MPNLKDLIKSIKIQISKTPQQIAEELNNASGFEYGLRHDNGHFALLRDDNVIEMNAGNGVSVTADGLGQLVSIESPAVSISAQSIQLQAPTNGYFFGYQAINPYWFTTNPLDLITPFSKAPLVPKIPLNGLILSTLYVSPVPTPAVVGPPTGGGVVTGLVPLSQFLETQPLFTPNQQVLIMAKSIGEIMKNVAGI